MIASKKVAIETEKSGNKRSCLGPYGVKHSEQLDHLFDSVIRCMPLLGYKGGLSALEMSKLLNENIKVMKSVLVCETFEKVIELHYTPIDSGWPLIAPFETPGPKLLYKRLTPFQVDGISI